MTNVNLNAPKALSTEKLQQYHQDVKANQVKADAMGGGNELATWLEEAVAWSQAVHSGQVADDPNIPVWQYDQWISQVQAQLYGTGGAGGGWDPTMGGMGTQPQVQPPQGAILGANGNFIYDGKKADIDYTGSAVQSEVESQDVLLAVNSMGADYNFSTVKDQVTGEDVLKLVVDGPIGQQTYVFNNVEDDDFHLEVYAANMESVDISDLPQEIQDKIGVSDIETLGEELATGSGATLDGAAFDPEPIKNADGVVTANQYTATNMDQHFRFDADPGQEPTSNYVIGNATINVPLDATANVIDTGPFIAADGVTYDYQVTVTRGNETQTFYMQKDFNHMITGRPGSITFNSVAGSDADIPEGFQNDFATSASTEAATAGAAEGTDAQAVIDGLMDMTDTNEAQFLEALQDAGFTELKDMDDVRKAITDGDFPPMPPTDTTDREGDWHQYVMFLVGIDDELYDAHQEWMQVSQGNQENSTPEEASDDFMGRFVELLGASFPDTKVREVAYDSDKQWAGNFSIGSDSYWLSIYQDGTFIMGS